MTQLQSNTELSLNTEPPTMVFQAFDQARSSLCSIIEGDLSILKGHSEFDRHLHDALRSAYSAAKGLLHNAALKRFAEAGVANVSSGDLSSFSEDFQLERGGRLIESIRKVDLSSYWEALMSGFEEFRLLGLRKYGKILADDLFRWGYARGNEPVRQKACLVFSVHASNGYSFSPGYSWDTQNSINSILEAIQFVEERNGLEKVFHHASCKLAMDELVSRNRVLFCEGCEIETLGTSVKFRLSYPLVERIQIFLAELGFSPTSC